MSPSLTPSDVAMGVSRLAGSISEELRAAMTTAIDQTAPQAGGGAGEAVRTCAVGRVVVMGSFQVIERTLRVHLGYESGHGMSN